MDINSTQFRIFCVCMCFLFIRDRHIKTELINSEINDSFATDWKAQTHGALSV